MFSMAVFRRWLVSLGSLFIFNAAVAQEYYVLAVLGVLTSVVAAYYYLRIIKVMFFDEPADAFDEGYLCAQGCLFCLCILFLVLRLNPTSFMASSFRFSRCLFSG